jgi:hypothetical protein
MSSSEKTRMPDAGHPHPKGELPMLRTIMIACAAAGVLGISAASAAPVNTAGIRAAFYENGAVQQVWWGGYRHHHRHFYRHHHRRWW